ncbi:MAG TPA: sugar transferase [Gemmatimonadales bacterium]|nr:sugar transferase [Gemmatimonadales bacterium]
MTGWELHQAVASGIRVERSNAACRALNLLVACVGLLLAAPMMFLIAALIKLTSRGPILYTQTRVGVDRRELLGSTNHRRTQDQGGKPFTIYKFRTMYAGDTRTAPQVWASQNDPRVTPVGRVLRKYRLDELPQFLNVLRGDMNVVGPRPEQPKIFAELRQQVPGYQTRQLVRPGITGLAQVNQKYDTSIDDVRRKVSFDLEYVARRSLFEDLRILARTIPVVLNKGGW